MTRSENFVHLHAHSTYSFGDGISLIPDMIARAKELGMPALALTDHGYGHGLLEFYEECKKAGIKPILGCEVYLSKGSRLLKDNEHKHANHLILLARNSTGYKNLLRILTDAATIGFYYEPRTDIETISQYAEGLICLTACMNGPVCQHLYNSDNGRAVYDPRKAEDTISTLRDIFGENLFFEAQYHKTAATAGGVDQRQFTIMTNGKELCSKLGIPIVATNDAHYIYPDQWNLRDIMMADRTQKRVADATREYRDEEGQYYIKSFSEMSQLFPCEWLDTSLEIADRVEEFDIGILPGGRLPKFCKDTVATAKVFGEKVKEGFKARFPGLGKDSEEYKRVQHEIKCIKTLGFYDYFLIVADLIEYATKNGIPIGPGRGSAAGSLVSYCLDITSLNPLKHDLLFERFLNPSRKTLPDIDIDVCKDKRALVIDYLSSKYGKDSVAQICTFSRIKGKGSLRVVGKALDVDGEVIEALASAMPRDQGEFSTSIEQVLDEDESVPGNTLNVFKQYKKDKVVQYYLQTCARLDGVYKSSGVHAAGIVVGPQPLVGLLPLKINKEGGITTQFGMEEVEKLGLLKLDLLGLDTLSTISTCLLMISQDNPSGPLHNKKGIRTSRDLLVIDPDCNDKTVYDAVFSRGRTISVFQCDSPGIRQLFARIHANCFEDIAAVIALYRPGPLDAGMTDMFVRRRNGKEKEEVWHEDLRPYVSYTHGLPIYQEQIMFASQVLCGFTMAEADNLRKIIGKKKKDDIIAFREVFVKAAEKVGKVSAERAGKIYDEIEYFGRYAFNKSHSSAYAVMTYQSAWLKKYYPAYWMAACLDKFVASNIETIQENQQYKTSKKNDDDKLRLYINEALSMGLTILPPNINTSGYSFRAIDSKTIAFGLGALKGVGTSLDLLIDERNKHGTWKDIKSFLISCVKLGINKKAITELCDTRCLNLGVSIGYIHTLIDGYPRKCRCLLKREIPKPDCGLCKGTGEAKPKSLLDDIRKALKEDDPEASLEAIPLPEAILSQQDEVYEIPYPGVYVITDRIIQ